MDLCGRENSSQLRIRRHCHATTSLRPPIGNCLNNLCSLSNMGKRTQHDRCRWSLFWTRRIPTTSFWYIRNNSSSSKQEGQQQKTKNIHNMYMKRINDCEDKQCPYFDRTKQGATATCRNYAIYYYHTSSLGQSAVTHAQACKRTGCSHEFFFLCSVLAVVSACGDCSGSAQ